ncbi:nitrile hydratase [Erwinia typographi]|uniref:nitrile hydratase n=1 Tax=Erwinia typographi TaxID=371042 RepID=A0A0A4A2Q6_9GAMM|nr:nitrile hydratase subunit alpha [Erwinia typographi]KGT92223.1 nitrile hydratase [Erwinia typographi]
MSDITEPTTPPNIPTLRIKAIQSLLMEKGYIKADAIDEIIDIFEHRFGPKNGAKVVAKAWTDPAYKARLLSDATAAIAELGFSGLEGAHMFVTENTESVHNMVVCTLCSCYPWPTLGLPPTWYKAPQYRSRAVIEPRKVLAEFNVMLPANVEIRVWDSNAEIRYMVLPLRPAGSEHLNAEELAELVTRNAMIGTDILPAVQS